MTSCSISIAVVRSGHDIPELHGSSSIVGSHFNGAILKANEGSAPAIFLASHKKLAGRRHRLSQQDSRASYCHRHFFARHRYLFARIYCVENRYDASRHANGEHPPQRS